MVTFIAVLQESLANTSNKGIHPLHLTQQLLRYFHFSLDARAKLSTIKMSQQQEAHTQTLSQKKIVRTMPLAFLQGL